MFKYRELVLSNSHFSYSLSSDFTSLIFFLCLIRSLIHSLLMCASQTARCSKCNRDYPKIITCPEKSAGACTGIKPAAPGTASPVGVCPACTKMCCTCLLSRWLLSYHCLNLSSNIYFLIFLWPVLLVRAFISMPLIRSYFLYSCRNIFDTAP